MKGSLYRIYPSLERVIKAVMRHEVAHGRPACVMLHPDTAEMNDIPLGAVSVIGIPIELSRDVPYGVVRCVGADYDVDERRHPAEFSRAFIRR